MTHQKSITPRPYVPSHFIPNKRKKYKIKCSTKKKKKKSRNRKNITLLSRKFKITEVIANNPNNIILLSSSFNNVTQNIKYIQCMPCQTVDARPKTQIIATPNYVNIN